MGRLEKGQEVRKKEGEIVLNLRLVPILLALVVRHQQLLQS